MVLLRTKTDDLEFRNQKRNVGTVIIRRQTKGIGYENGIMVTPNKHGRTNLSTMEFVF